MESSRRHSRSGLVAADCLLRVSSLTPILPLVFRPSLSLSFSPPLFPSPLHQLSPCDCAFASGLLRFHLSRPVCSRIGRAQSSNSHLAGIPNPPKASLVGRLPCHTLSYRVQSNHHRPCLSSSPSIARSRLYLVRTAPVIQFIISCLTCASLVPFLTSSRSRSFHCRAIIGPRDPPCILPTTTYCLPAISLCSLFLYLFSFIGSRERPAFYSLSSWVHPCHHLYPKACLVYLPWLVAGNQLRLHPLLAQFAP